MTIENRVAELEKGFSAMQESINGMTALLQSHMDGTHQKISEQLDDIAAFITGANTVFGFTKKHWKTALTFGAGLMSAAGIGNPAVWQFINGFFGG